ncbi:signal peptidase I [Leifsonia sp. NPDC058194]|uniref:signal peptidase I n=1 Tax=Leifsonia sp. NPDC058194 TaxID=3346374 RepID=UPI0036DE59E8
MSIREQSGLEARHTEPPIAHAAATTATAQRRTAGRAASRAGDVLLTLASVAGALCIVGAVAAAVFHITLILFSTGSMSPTIPAGAVAIVREIPASEARVGDVVTVDRPGALPITHRVVSAQPLAGGRTELVLRGDANAENDPAPYDVTHVRLVLTSVPGGAQVIAFFSNPLFLGGATLAATVLVAWAFWPRDGDRTSRREDREGGQRRRARRSGRRAGGPGGALLLLAVAGGAAVPAVAAPAPARADESVSSSRYLTLTSIADPAAFAELRPGVPVRWEVGVAAATPAPATVGLGLASTGPLTAALDVAVLSCPVRWVGGTCAGSAQTLVAATPLPTLLTGRGATTALPPAPAGVAAIGGMPSGEQRWLAVEVTLQPGASTGSADLEVWAWTSADDARAAAPPVALAATGSAPPLLAPLLAGGAVVAGAAIAGTAGARRHRLERGGTP